MQMLLIAEGYTKIKVRLYEEPTRRIYTIAIVLHMRELQDPKLAWSYC